jgi:hypothetical protein
MDIFMTHGLSPAQLISLNNTHMYKQVICTSNISSADGLSILPTTTFTNSPPTHPTPFEWPRCSRPTDNDITLWIDTIRSCYLPPHTTHRRLTIPLGLFYHSDSITGYGGTQQHSTSYIILSIRNGPSGNLQDNSVNSIKAL